MPAVARGILGPVRRERIEEDQAFFAERLARRPAGARRSLARARALAPHVGVDLDAWRARPQSVVTVVGSKGKGTAAAFASATLCAAGLRVGTLSSPGLRSNRERIRVDGRAISRADYVRLVREVSTALDLVAGRLPDGGYLSPSGLFTLAALRHFAERGCDAIVAEAGMGGASDEVSLLSPAVVALTAVLEEHIGVLGASVPEIATEKAGVVTDATRALVTGPQPHPAADAAIDAAVRGHRCERHRVDGGDPWPPGGLRSGPGRPATPSPPPGLGGLSARVGVLAALHLLDARGVAAPGADVLAAVLSGVRLPGRLSHHRRGEQRWIVDCATNPTALTVALEHSDASIGPPTAVLTFIPQHRDGGPLLAALRGRPVVRVPGGRSSGRPGEGAVMRLDRVDLDALGPRVLAAGPVYFAGEVLALLGVDCETSFEVPPVPRPGS